MAQFSLLIKSPWFLRGGIPRDNCVRAYAPRGAVSLAASYYDLTGNESAAPGTAPTWDGGNGWKLDGASNQYLLTGLVPTGTTSVVCRFSNVGSTTGRKLFGVYEASGKMFLLALYANATKHEYAWGNHTGSGIYAEPAPSSGVVICTPTGLWLDGVLKDDLSSSTWGDMTMQMYVGAMNVSDAISSPITGFIQYWAAYDIDIAAQATALSAAIAAL